MATGTDPGDGLLATHLRAWLGGWPPRAPVDVVATDIRRRPSWDGTTTALVGVGGPDGIVLSVAPQHADAVRAAIAGADLDDDSVRTAVAHAAGAEDHVLGRGVFRWATTVAPASQMPDIGEWVRPDDPRVPRWLTPFNYRQVLIAWDVDGAYGAGVGIKRHDAVGHEIAVVTNEHLRGTGVARRLVAQAARRVLGEGGLPTYLHGPGNVASARVAEAVGFADRGWSVYGLFPVG